MPGVGDTAESWKQKQLHDIDMYMPALLRTLGEAGTNSETLDELLNGKKGPACGHARITSSGHEPHREDWRRDPRLRPQVHEETATRPQSGSKSLGVGASLGPESERPAYVYDADKALRGLAARGIAEGREGSQCQDGGEGDRRGA